MGSLHIPRREVTQPGRLPRVCMVCGKQAEDEVWFTYKSQFVHPEGTALSPREAAGVVTSTSWVSEISLLGPVLVVLFLLGYYLVLPLWWCFSWLTTTRFRGLSPRCRQHLTAPGLLRLREKDATRVVLEGLHEGFIQAYRHPEKSPP